MVQIAEAISYKGSSDAVARACLVALNRIAQGVTSGSESSSQEQVREKD